LVIIINLAAAPAERIVLAPAGAHALPGAKTICSAKTIGFMLKLPGTYQAKPIVL
jgi:hypothetical protein